MRPSHSDEDTQIHHPPHKTEQRDFLSQEGGDEAPAPRPYGKNQVSSKKDLGIKVHCQIKVYYLTNVDVKNNHFEVDFLVALDWFNEELLTWQTDNPGRKVNFVEQKFFVPTVEIDNVHGTSTLVEVGGHSPPRTYGSQHPGWSKLTQRYRGHLQTFFTVREFPFDQHLLQIVVKVRTEGVKTQSSLTHPSNVVRNGKHLFNANADFLPDWKIHSFFGVENAERDDTYSLCIHIKRNQMYIVWNVGFLFVLLELLVFVAFGVDFDQLEERMSITLTVILTAVAFKFVLKDDLPNVPYLTILDKYLIAGFLLMFFQGMENMGVSFLDEVRSQQVDIISGIALGLFFLCIHLWVLLLYYSCTIPMTYTEFVQRDEHEALSDYMNDRGLIELQDRHVANVDRSQLKGIRETILSKRNSMRSGMTRRNFLRSAH